MPDPLLVPLFDKLIQLATLKETRKRKIFEDHVESLYRDLEKVVADYIVMVGLAVALLKREDSILVELQDLVAKLESDRLVFRGKRLELRSALNLDSVQRAECVELFLSKCRFLVLREIFSDERDAMLEQIERNEFVIDRSAYTLSRSLIEMLNGALSNPSIPVRPIPLLWVERLADELEDGWSEVSSAYHKCRQDLLS